MVLQTGEKYLTLDIGGAKTILSYIKDRKDNQPIAKGQAHITIMGFNLIIPLVLWENEKKAKEELVK